MVNISGSHIFKVFVENHGFDGGDDERVQGFHR